MPRTKRSKLVSLTRTDRKTREDKSNLMDLIRTSANDFAYVWLFSIGNMRNSYLKEVRKLWEGSRIFFGKNRVMAKALGDSQEEEIKKGIAALAQRLSGSVGLLFTDSPPAEVADWFETHERKDFARTGNVAKETVVLPEGPVMTRTEPPETLAGSIEPQLRKLGMPTELKRGVPTLRQEFTVCKVGKRIDTNAAQILKHLSIQQASFRIVPLAYHSSIDETVTELPLSEEDRLLVAQANGKDDDVVPGQKRDAPGVVKRSIVKKSNKTSTATAGDDDEDAMEDDEMDSEEESDEGDKVTEEMMLPAHLR